MLVFPVLRGQPAAEAAPTVELWSQMVFEKLLWPHINRSISKSDLDFWVQEKQRNVTIIIIQSGLDRPADLIRDAAIRIFSFPI